MLCNVFACFPKSKILKLESNAKNCCEMMPDIPIKAIQAQRDILSSDIFTFIIQAKATKTCACIEDETKQAACYDHFK